MKCKKNWVELRPEPIRAALHQFLALDKWNRIRTHLHARQVQINVYSSTCWYQLGFWRTCSSQSAFSTKEQVWSDLVHILSTHRANSLIPMQHVCKKAKLCLNKPSYSLCLLSNLLNLHQQVKKYCKGNENTQRYVTLCAQKIRSTSRIINMNQLDGMHTSHPSMQHGTGRVLLKPTIGISCLYTYTAYTSNLLRCYAPWTMEIHTAGGKTNAITQATLDGTTRTAGAAASLIVGPVGTSLSSFQVIDWNRGHWLVWIAYSS